LERKEKQNHQPDAVSQQQQSNNEPEKNIYWIPAGCSSGKEGKTKINRLNDPTTTVKQST